MSIQARRVHFIITKQRNEIRRLKVYYDVFCEWINIKNHQIVISDYLLKRGFHVIAIYGMGRVGCLMSEELSKDERIKHFGIDRNASAISLKNGVRVYSLAEEMTPADIIIITAIGVDEKIVTMLGDKLSCQALTIQEVIMDIID